MALPPLLATIDAYTQSSVDSNQRKIISDGDIPKTVLRSPIKSPRPPKSNDSERNGTKNPRIQSKGTRLLESKEKQILGSELDGINSLENSTWISNLPERNNNDSLKRGARNTNKRNSLDVLPPSAPVAHPSFVRAIESLAAIRLHAFTKKRKELIEQKLSLLQEIKNYQHENLEDSVESLQKAFVFMLAAWKLRFSVELLRSKRLLSKLRTAEANYVTNEGRFQHEINTLRKILGDMTSQIKDLEGQKGLLESKESDLSLRLEEVETKLLGKSNELSILEDNIRTLNVNNDNRSKCFEAYIRDLESTIKTKDSRIVSLESELSITRDTCQSLVAKNVLYEAQIKANENTIASLTKKLEDMDRQYLHDVDSMSAVYVEEKDSLNQEWSHRVDIWQEKIQLFEEENKALHSKVSNISSKLVILENENADYRKQHHDITQILEEKTVANVDLVTELSLATKEKEGIQSILADVGMKLKDAESNFFDQSIKLSKLQEKYEKTKFVRNQLRASLKAHEIDLEDAKSTIKGLEDLHTSTREQLETATMRTEDLETGWGITLNSLVSTTGYCRFLEDQLFSMRKMKRSAPAGRPTSMYKSNDESRWSNSSALNWDDYSFFVNGDGKPPGLGEGSGTVDEPQENEVFPSNGLTLEKSPSETMSAVGTSPIKYFSVVSPSPLNDKMVSLVQHLEEKLKTVDDMTDKMKNLMSKEDSPSESRSNLFFADLSHLDRSMGHSSTYSSVRDATAKLFVSIDKRISTLKPEITEKKMYISRLLETINQNLQKKRKIVEDIDNYWDSYSQEHHKVPSFSLYIDFCRSFIPNNEVLDYKLQAFLPLAVQAVEQVIIKQEVIESLEVLFEQVRSGLRDKGSISREQEDEWISQFDSLESKLSEKNSVLMIQELSDKSYLYVLEILNESLMKAHLDVVASDKMLVIPLYHVLVEDFEKKIKKSMEEKAIQDELEKLKAKEYESSESEITKLARSLALLEHDLQDMLNALNRTVRDIHSCKKDIEGYFGRMVEWIREYIKICRRHPNASERQKSKIFRDYADQYSSKASHLLKCFENSKVMITQMKALMIQGAEINGRVESKSFVSLVQECEHSIGEVPISFDLKPLEEIGSDLVVEDIAPAIVATAPVDNPTTPSAAPLKSILSSEMDISSGGQPSPLSKTANRRVSFGDNLILGDEAGNETATLDAESIDKDDVDGHSEFQLHEGDNEMKNLSKSIYDLQRKIEELEGKRERLMKTREKKGEDMLLWIDGFIAEFKRDPTLDEQRVLGSKYYHAFHRADQKILSIDKKLDSLSVELGKKIQLMDVSRASTAFSSAGENQSSFLSDAPEPPILESLEMITSDPSLRDMSNPLQREDKIEAPLGLEHGDIDTLLHSRGVFDSSSFSLPTTANSNYYPTSSPDIIVNDSVPQQSYIGLTSVDTMISQDGDLFGAWPSETERLENDLASVATDITNSKSEMLQLKAAYEAKRDEYQQLTAKNDAIKNEINLWIESFKKENGRSPTSNEKKNQLGDKLNESKKLKQEMMDMYQVLIEIKSQFDSKQSELVALKGKRNGIRSRSQSPVERNRDHNRVDPRNMDSQYEAISGQPENSSLVNGDSQQQDSNNVLASNSFEGSILFDDNSSIVIGRGVESLVLDENTMSIDLAGVTTDITNSKSEMLQLKAAYEAKRDEYQQLTAKNDAIKNEINLWIESFKKENGRSPTSNEKKNQLGDKLNESKKLKQEMMDMYQVLIEIKSQFDSKQSELVALKGKRNGIRSRSQSPNRPMME